MQTTFALAALAAVAYAAPQGVTGNISPTSSAPAGCSGSYSGAFEITIINSTTTKRRDLSKRDSTCGKAGYLTLTLSGNNLLDAQGRTGYIASNYQFQFDKPAQTGAIYTSGWSVCGNGSLALGGSSVFYECLSGDFYNLYDRSWAAQCEPVLIDVMPCGASGGATQAPDGQPAATTILPHVSQISDGQPQAQSAVPAPVTQIGDGQVQAPTGKPVTQIGDGQVQAPTGKPVTQISDGQVQAPTGKPVTQISDGQVQAPTATGKPVTQISDGQVQAPTGKPVTQISDGQIQAPTATGKPVTQISDGQIQAPTGKPVTQISDGQIQAPKTTAVPVSQKTDGVPTVPKTTGAPVIQISDGQIQATGAPKANATSSAAPFKGAGNSHGVQGGFAAVVLGAVGMFLL